MQCVLNPHDPRSLFINLIGCQDARLNSLLIGSNHRGHHTGADDSTGKAIRIDHLRVELVEHPLCDEVGEPHSICITVRTVRKIKEAGPLNLEPAFTELCGPRP